MGGRQTLKRCQVLPYGCQMRPLFFLGPFSLGIVAGCQSREPANLPLAVIEVKFEEPDSCRFSIDGSDFSLSADEQTPLAALKEKARVYTGAHIEAGPSIPSKCIGRAIVLAQRAGFQRVGFIAEPPPPTRQ